MGRLAYGKTAPGSGWQSYSDGVCIDVDTSSANFSTSPKYAISLGGSTYCWPTTGGNVVYNPTAKGFRVCIRRTDKTRLTPADAESCGLHIQWIGLEGDEILIEGQTV